MKSIKIAAEKKTPIKKNEVFLFVIISEMKIKDIKIVTIFMINEPHNKLIGSIAIKKLSIFNILLSGRN